MHALAADFGILVSHGFELLDKLGSAKVVNDPLIREIYSALELNSDLLRSWQEAKHTVVQKIFGQKGA